MKLNLLKLFTRDEPIAGLEISDSCLRLALLLKEEKGELRAKSSEEEALEIKALGEKPLKGGIIGGGEIKKKEDFIAALNELLKDIKPRIRYAVVSIPADNVYARLYSFPKTVSGEKLEETMKLTVGFQLPVKVEDTYLDWEKTSAETRRNEVFLATIRKPIIDNYLEALAAVGLRTVAIEFHPMSVARAADISPGKTVLALISGKENITVSVIENKTVRFNRTIPANRTNAASFAEEIRKVVDFYESENKTSISEIVSIGETSASDDRILPAKIMKLFSGHPKISKDSGKWLIAVGAAWRGLLPRAEDALVSLMPIGTEEAYENQKALAFAEFLSAIVIGLSAFFAVVFVGVWILMTSVQQSFNGRLQSLISLPLPTDAPEIESRARNLNETVGKASNILGTIFTWSGLLEELKSRTIPGIAINSVSLPAPDATMNLTGIAQNRPQLNSFKKSLEESSLLTEVALPLANLEMKESIPFLISFRLR